MAWWGHHRRRAQARGAAPVGTRRRPPASTGSRMSTRLHAVHPAARSATHAGFTRCTPSSTAESRRERPSRIAGALALTALLAVDSVRPGSGARRGGSARRVARVPRRRGLAAGEATAR
jgi:hypothetical protein